jgi:hypothetical protein
LEEIGGHSICCENWRAVTEVLARKVRINWRRAKNFSSGGNTRPKSVLKCSPRKTKSWDGMTSRQSDPIHRRFPSGMGSLSGGSNCFRDVVFHPLERSHQSFGNEGSSVSSFSFQTLSHNNVFLPDSSGRRSLLCCLLPRQ